MNSNPTLIVEAVRALIILGTAFGLAINAEQQAAIIGAAGAVFALVSFALAWYNRSKVYAPATVQKIADAATNLPPGSVVDIGQPPEGIAEGQG